MRKVYLAALLLAMMTGIAAAADGRKGDDVVRVPVLDGIYSVEAPGEWHVEVSGKDYTATFSEEPGSDGTLVIAPPNPMVEDIEEYTRLSIEGLFRAFGNGDIDEENHDEVGGYPAYTAIFLFKAGDEPFIGWARTIDIEEYAVQAISLTSAKNYVEFMQRAGDIVDSYELDLDEARANSVVLRRIGRQTLHDLKSSAAKEGAAADK